MALQLFDRVQVTATANTTVSFTLGSAVAGFQSFSVMTNGNTTYYGSSDGTNWEVGIGTYSTTGPTLTRTTILSSSNSGSAVTFTGTPTVWIDYPSSKSVYQDANTNVNANSFIPGWASTTTAAGTTTLTTSSTYYQRFVGSTTQTVQLPNATTVNLGQGFIIDNDSTGALALQDATPTSLGSVVPGMAVFVFCENNSTAAGSWSGYMFVPGGGPSGQVTWGTAGLAMGNQTISGVNTISMAGQLTSTLATGTAPFVVSSTTQVANLNAATAGTAGNVTGVVATANGGTGLSGATPFTANGAVYATSTSALTTGTLPIASGGTNSTATATAGGVGYGTGTAHAYTAAGTSGQPLISAGAGAPAFGALAIGTANTNVSGALTATNGGTGVATLTGLAYGNGTSAFTAATAAQVVAVISTTAVANATAAVTFSSTTQNSQFNSLGVGTAGSTTAGEIRATNNITAYYSDSRLKDFKGTIPNALAKVQALNGYYFTENARAKELGYNNDKLQVGVSAQEVEDVLPEVITEAPINANFEGADYKTVYYDKLVPLLIEAIKELKAEVDLLKAK